MVMLTTSFGISQLNSPASSSLHLGAGKVVCRPTQYHSYGGNSPGCCVPGLPVAIKSCTITTISQRTLQQIRRTTSEQENDCFTIFDDSGHILHEFERPFGITLAATGTSLINSACPRGDCGIMGNYGPAN
ncbi:hypothetical protein TWF506_001659 [Arthrobotrys conoides]|uniref:Uncharacterized protein n=1 Tax=Arthrobotrys conoides TaxID=74498 RepID=A0AAN8S5K3_9PEZI